MVPDKEVVRRLFEEIAPRFTDRPGGYTRVMRLGRRRGDGAELAIIEFVDYDLSDHEEGGTPSKGKGSLMDRAKGVFGGGTKKVDDEVDEEMAAAEDEAEETVEAAAEESEPKTAEAEEPAEEPEAEVEAAPAEEPEEAKAEEPAEEPETAEAAEPEEEKKNS